MLVCMAGLAELFFRLGEWLEDLLGLAELFFRLGEWSRGGPAILPGETRRVKRGYSTSRKGILRTRRVIGVDSTSRVSQGLTLTLSLIKD